MYYVRRIDDNAIVTLICENDVVLAEIFYIETFVSVFVEVILRWCKKIDEWFLFCISVGSVFR